MTNPYPISISILPWPGPTILYNIGDLAPKAGLVLGSVRVFMSNGSDFQGEFNSNGPLLLVHPQGALKMPNIVLSRDLTSADDGSHTWTMTFTQNGVSVSATFPVSIVSPPPVAVPVSVALSPSSATMDDTATAGTLVTNAEVAMSDGSTFSGSMSAVDENGNAAPVQIMPPALRGFRR